MTLQHEEYYIGFRAGDEKALSYVYVRYYRPLLHHGRRILNDEFAASCIVHEAFLKGWQFRESMESMRHIYCYIRLNVSWRCYAWLRNPGNIFHRSLVPDEPIESYSHVCDTTDTVFYDEQKLRAIEEALPYLPANRQTIMALYFKHGVSYKKIARRFGASVPAISAEVRESLASLKNIVHAQKKLAVKTLPATPHGHGYTKNMNPQIKEVFTLRYEQKQSFAAIAEQLDLTIGEVHRHYLAAHRLLKAQAQ